MWKYSYLYLLTPPFGNLFPNVIWILFCFLRYAGLSLLWPLPLRSTVSGRAGSAVMAHGRSRSAACGIFLDQGTNPCPLHQQADSQPLRHQGSPQYIFWLWLWVLLWPTDYLKVCCLFSMQIENFFIFLLYISSLIPPWNIYFMISILWNLLRLAFWLSTRSILVKVPRMLEKNVHSAVVGYKCQLGHGCW